MPPVFGSICSSCTASRVILGGCYRKIDHIVRPPRPKQLPQHDALLTKALVCKLPQVCIALAEGIGMCEKVYSQNRIHIFLSGRAIPSDTRVKTSLLLCKLHSECCNGDTAAHLHSRGSYILGVNGSFGSFHTSERLSEL